MSGSVLAIRCQRHADAPTGSVAAEFAGVEAWVIVTNTPGSLAQSTFLRACRRETVPFTPVWFMRQAGRSLPEYREVRTGVGMLESCQRPDLVTEITLQPVRRHKVDAAIFFSDIVVPLKAIGIDLDIVAGVGPVVAEPIRSLADLDRLRPLEPTDVEYVTEAVTMLVHELGPTPLIGFAGAPFTLASYLVEGGPSRTHARTKALMYGEPGVWHGLCERLAEITSAFLRVQIEAGASAIQLFDSWAGALSEADYRMYVQPHSARVLGGLGAASVPRIHFGVGTGELLGAMGEAGADVVGADWRIPLDVASKRIGGDKAVQGNLDPALVFAGERVIEKQVRRVVDEGRQAPGHVFNLGHGVLPETDPGVLTRIVELVHEHSRR
jgi:uroporphyrinogen decarboxylase